MGESDEQKVKESSVEELKTKELKAGQDALEISTKTNKGTLAIIVVLCILIPAVIILAILHRGTMEERLELQAAGEFMITSGEEKVSVSLADLLDIGAVEVTSSPRGERRDFTGVPLVRVFDRFGVDYSEARTVVFTSLDGFVTALTIAEVLDEENTFIVFEEDGEPLGTREEGGRGPYMVVVALDPFPNRWARYLMEVTLQ